MVLAAALSAAAQAQDVAELFLKMPDTQLVLLNEASRKTLVDMHRAGEKATVNNEMGGMAEIWKMTDDYLWLETSMGNFIQIRRAGVGGLAGASACLDDKSDEHARADLPCDAG